MNSFIKHLVEITGHRDHDLLNISVASSLRELLLAEQATVFEVASMGGHTVMRPKIRITAEGTDVLEQVTDADDLFPEQISGLWQGLEQKQGVIRVTQDGQDLLWLPIWINDKLHTCLQLSRPQQAEEPVMEVVHGMLIVYRNFQNLLDYSERDSLTGLLNRKTFDDSFSKVLRTNLREMTPLEVTEDAQQSVVKPETERREQDAEKFNWLAVLDIDHFKRVNDQFGHLYGDEVLILIANLLRNSFRPNDRLFRFGGEEFVILLRSVTKQDADQIFDRFRETVGNHHFPQVGTVTVSIGYAKIDLFEPAVAIVGRADQALYYAKMNGRNRSCFYDSLVASGDLHQEQANDIAEFF